MAELVVNGNEELLEYVLRLTVMGDTCLFSVVLGGGVCAGGAKNLLRKKWDFFFFPLNAGVQVLNWTAVHILGCLLSLDYSRYAVFLNSHCI